MDRWRQAGFFSEARSLKDPHLELHALRVVLKVEP